MTIHMKIHMNHIRQAAYAASGICLICIIGSAGLYLLGMPYDENLIRLGLWSIIAASMLGTFIAVKEEGGRR